MLTAARRSRSRSRSGRSRLRAMYAARGRAPSIPRATARLTRRPRITARGVHTFSRYCASTDPIECNGVYKAGSIVTSLSQLVQSSDFTNLFDQYRIRRVIVSIQMINNPDAVTVLNGQGSGLPFNPSNWYPKIWYIPDYDGGSDETISSIKERQGVRCKIFRPNTAVRFSFVPKCRVLTYSTSTSTGYAPKNIMVDMTDTAVEHFGIKYVIDTNQQDPQNEYPFKFVIEKKLVFSCYGVR